MRFQSIIALLSGHAALISSAPLTGAITAAPSGTSIKAVSYGGTGCAPNGSASWTSDGTFTILNLLTPSLSASTGPGTSIGDARKNCQFNFDIRYPAGWQYAVDRVDYSGHDTLGSGVSGQARGLIYYSGQTAQSSFSSPLSGISDADFSAVYLPTDAGTLWSPCGNEGLLNVNMQSQLTSNSATAGKILVSVATVVLEWRTC